MTLEPPKNPAAQALNRLRNQKLSPPQRSAIASKAGQARKTTLTPEQRKAIWQKAIQTRWARYRRAHGLPPKPGDERFL